MCVNNLSKVALDSAAAGIEPAISSRKFNALTTTPPSHTARVVWQLQPKVAQTVQHHVSFMNLFRYVGHVTIFSVECSLLRAV